MISNPLTGFEKTLAAIAELKALDLVSVDDSDVREFIESRILQFPITTCFLKKGSVIYRARRTAVRTAFNNQSEISYPPAAKKNPPFGRTSGPGFSVFYGSLDPDTAVYEISSVRRLAEAGPKQEIVTLGRWVVKSDLHLFQFVHHEKARNENAETKEHYQRLDKMFRSHGQSLYDRINPLLEFFSNEFARSVGSPHEYKITRAFYEILMVHKWRQSNGSKWKPLDGALYPSVRKDFRGLNVSLAINSVDENLRLHAVQQFRVRKKFRIDNKWMAVSFIPSGDTYRISADGAFRLKPPKRRIEIITAYL